MKRPGHTLVELLFALTLGGMIATVALKLLQTQMTVARVTAERGRRAEALRTAAQVLTAETRLLVPERDVRALGPDSIALRAFRGAGIVCALEGTRAHLRFRGSRAPDPTKDSILVLRDTIFEAVGALVASVPAAGCAAAAGEQIFALSSNLLLQTGDAVALFESGSYYLADGALRYRLGREGRQPVTNELFENRRTSFEAPGGADAHALLTLRASKSTARSALRVRLPFSARTP